MPPPVPPTFSGILYAMKCVTHHSSTTGGEPLFIGKRLWLRHGFHDITCSGQRAPHAVLPHLRDRSVLLHISCRPPYLSVPVAARPCQAGTGSRGVWRCPLHSKSPVGTGTGSWVSPRCPPCSRSLGRVIHGRENHHQIHTLYTNTHNTL